MRPLTFRDYKRHLQATCQALSDPWSCVLNALSLPAIHPSLSVSRQNKWLLNCWQPCLSHCIHQAFYSASHSCTVLHLIATFKLINSKAGKANTGTSSFWEKFKCIHVILILKCIKVTLRKNCLSFFIVTIIAVLFIYLFIVYLKISSSVAHII